MMDFSTKSPTTNTLADSLTERTLSMLYVTLSKAEHKENSDQ